MKTGMIFNIQKFSIQDGPGIRTTVFLQGCPLHCQWCHNPESQSFQPRLLLFPQRCVGCGRCQSACSQQALNNPARCRHCGQCAAACPALARELAGRRVTVTEVLQAVTQDRVFYEESGGGVTFSGGEPLAQPAFLLALLQACQEQGLQTAVDTSGYAHPAIFETIAPFTDLFLYDLKVMAEEKHLLYTGVSNRLILNNLQLLTRMRKRFFLRLPIIPGINDDEEHLSALIVFLRELGEVEQINLLPYHPLARDKYRRLQQDYSLADTPEPTAAQLEKIAALLAPCCQKIKIGG